MKRAIVDFIDTDGIYIPGLIPIGSAADTIGLSINEQILTLFGFNENDPVIPITHCSVFLL